MGKRIRIRANSIEVTAELNGTNTAEAITSSTGLLEIPLNISPFSGPLYSPLFNFLTKSPLELYTFTSRGILPGREWVAQAIQGS